MVCFAQYSLYLHFSDDLLLTVESPFLHESPGDGYSSGWQEFPVAESRITRLLESEVVAAKLTDGGMIALQFANGDLLSISEAEDYESYRIKTKAREVIV